MANAGKKNVQAQKRKTSGSKRPVVRKRKVSSKNKDASILNFFQRMKKTASLRPSILTLAAFRWIESSSNKILAIRKREKRFAGRR